MASPNMSVHVDYLRQHSIPALIDDLISELLLHKPANPVAFLRAALLQRDPSGVKKILQLNTSCRSAGANSTRLANLITARLRARHPDAAVEVRDFARSPHPHLDEAAIGALFTPAEHRTPEQAARVALDDALIAQLQSADIVVLGVPMYNAGFSVQFKSWIDAITRAHVTFQYTSTGPEGLLKGKKVFVALARGGVYRDTPGDTQLPFIQKALSFVGLTDVTYIYAEGTAMGGPAGLDKAFETAEAEIKAAIP